MKAKEIKARLEYLRGEIQAERISYDEIRELQSLAAHIAPDDVLLLQWAGVPEHGKCEHKWETVHSYGAWGHESKCVHCGETATFTEVQS